MMTSHSNTQHLTLIEWASKWRIPPQALKELCDTALHLTPPDDPKPEAYVQSQVRLEAARKGKYLFRNNRGAGKMASGVFVRFGLANDSEKLGAAVKSADLIGIERVEITPAMVGSVIGRFLSVECKRSDWRPSNTLEEMAQVQWAAIINAQGGRALITNAPGNL